MGTNNTVVWSNSDVPAIHTATDSGVFDTGDLTTVPYQFTFTATGTYHYTCKYHAWMQGTIIVKAA